MFYIEHVLRGFRLSLVHLPPKPETEAYLWVIWGVTSEGMSKGWRLSRAGACYESGSAVGHWRSVQGLAEEAYDVHLRAAGLAVKGELHLAITSRPIRSG